jgi:light-regulated signal transduction histidine kinase (bacteriophytochrome)
MPIQDMVDARNALNKKNEELEHFAFVASHDLREPLRMIKSFLGLLEKKYADLLDEDGKKYIAYAVDGAERMRELIEGLLNFATVGSDSIQKQSVNMNDILSTVKIFFKNNIEETNAVIKAADLPVIPASPVYMQLLLQNLIANAIKYQPVGTAPEIEIKYVDDANYWQFSVKDNGIGIKEEFLETIFKIFKRLHTKSDYEGTGLGLSTSKKIVEAHGGEIWVDSEHGNGSTFHFTIPK